MPIVKLRDRGQITIPSEYRKSLGLKSEDVLNILKVGDMLILVPRRLEGDLLASKMEQLMKGKGLTLDDLFEDLKQQRKKYMKDKYAEKIQGLS